MNRLKNASSPYLLQHAANPVDWYPWGAEALAKSKAEQKPIFLSIGYSTCYWCHVMERDVFENKNMAALMNAHFINVKVDREERPDLDDLYMAARQLLTHEGGWPNNLFLTPDLKPFFACGTLLSKASSRGGMNFGELVAAIHHGWTEKRAEVLQTANAVTERLQALFKVDHDPAHMPGVKHIHELTQYLSKHADQEYGGFYHAPKFPQETYLLFLLDAAKKKNPTLLNIVKKSLDGMGAGGLFDHLAGGFHRYSVDEKWRVPHFEKMLYNQALLSLLYTRAFEQEGNRWYEAIARATLDFTAHELKSSEGGFYSGLDAETDHVEGAFYVWDEAEVRKILSPSAAEIFFECFGIEPLPAFPGHKMPKGGALYAKDSFENLARKRGEHYPDFQHMLDKILGKLLLARQSRKRPSRDEKILAGWNGLMIESFAVAGQVFEAPRYLEQAKQAAQFILDSMCDQRMTLKRNFFKGKSSGEGFLEDYAFFARGLLALYRATGDIIWLKSTVDIMNRADDLFYDRVHGGFFLSHDTNDLIVRLKVANDGALPSANAAMLHVLVDLMRLTPGTRWHNKVWQARAESILKAFGARVTLSVESHTSLLHGLMRLQESEGLQESPEPVIKSGSTESRSKMPESSHYVRTEIQFDENAVLPEAEFDIEITLKIAPGWHLQANPATAPQLVPTSISAESEHARIKRFSYPSPVTKDAMRIYEDVIKITLPIKLTRGLNPGNIETLEIKISYQACSENACLPPSHLVYAVPLLIR